MQTAAIDEVIACLPSERTLFHYHSDRYALMLLSWAVGDGCRVDHLRRGRLAALLEKPLVKQVLASCGDGKLDRATLEAAWPASCNTFVLTLDRWGSNDRYWDQTSRHGSNLVLQLNFNHGHDHAYRRLIKPGSAHPFSFYSHPVRRPDPHRNQRRNQSRKQRPHQHRETLAWARLDFDLDSGEALIEEIQSDWVRRVAWMAGDAQDAANDAQLQDWWDCPTSAKAVTVYAEEVFAPYRKLWDQAMLSAAIHFLRDEIGIADIWYHSWDGGNRLKRLRYNQPPRSLYTRLPQRFCFDRTEQAPGFIARTRDYRKLLSRGGPLEWYKLAV